VPQSVVIVGASLGGLRTAEALRRFGFGGSISLIGDEPYLPYNRPPLSKEGLSQGVSHEVVMFPQRETTADVEWVLGSRVVSADLERQVLIDSSGRTWPYDHLVAATGVRAAALDAGSPALAGRYRLRTVDDAIALRAALRHGRKVVVVGAGFIGCEVAATARLLGCDVTVIGAAALPMLRPLGVGLAANLLRRHEDRGVRFVLSSRVVDVAGHGSVQEVVLSDGTTVPCDVLVEAVGSRPNTEWLDGNDLDLSQGVLTDGGMRARRRNGVAWPNVSAVGDVARFPNPLFGQEARTTEHWAIPTETGRRAAQVIASMGKGPGELEALLRQPFAPMPSFWTDQYDAHVLAYGALEMATESRLVAGDPERDCVFGYFRDDVLVGACGIGYRGLLRDLRGQIIARQQNDRLLSGAVPDGPR
jgi:3-phenylpropionate/trans-cinnamate dioxygenase ferredoxin reductase subunit